MTKPWRVRGDQPVADGARAGCGSPWRALVIAATLVLCAPLHGGGVGDQVAHAARTAGAGSGWASLSGAAQGVISGTVGRDDARYWVRPSAGNPTLVNPGQHLTARFTPAGAEIITGDACWGLGLAAVGHGDRLAAVPAAAPVAEANRVSYRRGSIDEWYVNGPAGLEQGFTLAERPVGAADQRLTLALGAPSSLTGHVDPGGAGLIQTHGCNSLGYQGLAVSDATGRPLPAQLELHGGQVLVRVDDRRAQYPVTVDPFVQAAKLVASDGATKDGLGTVAVSGNTVVVGAYHATVGANAGQGAAYVFIAPTGPGGTLTQAAKLTASDGAASDRFGGSVAIDGNTVVVGANEATVGANAHQGAVYVFVQPAGGWAGALTQTAKLTASDGAAVNILGISVGISGGTVVAGAYNATVGANTAQGAGYVFVQPAGGWAGAQTQTAKLTASDGAANDMFGASAGISGGTVVFGAYHATVGANSGQGAAYVFVQPAGGWAGSPTAPLHESAKLTASDGNEDDALGYSAGISGTTVVAGAYQTTVTHPGQGAAYVFVQPTGGWAGQQNESAKLTASDGAGNDKLGYSVAVWGNVVVAGAINAKIGANFSQGAAYVFIQPAAGWTGTAAAPQIQTAKLTAGDGATSDMLGTSVAISGTTLVAGAPNATVGGNTQQGAGYLFEAAPAATTTTLGVTPASPVAAGTGEMLSATITPAAAGIVQFMDGSTPLGAPVAVTGGTGALTTPLGSGTHQLSAVFTPTDQTPLTGFTGSTSTTLSYTVNAKRPLCIRICS